MIDKRPTREELVDAFMPFINWFENNFGDEQWLDSDDFTDGEDGTWKSYLELPEYLEATKALDD